MKVFSIFKTGYTSGGCGCTGEYFTAIIINKDGVHSYMFEGIYTNGQYIKEYLRNEGYTEFHTSANWGRLSRNDINPSTKNEEATLETIKRDQEKKT